MRMHISKGRFLNRKSFNWHRNGDFMNTKIQGGARIQHIVWPTGIIGGLFLISLGLELLAHQVFGQTDLGTLLWALYLSFWSFVLGATGLLFFIIRWLMAWRRVRADQVVMHRDGSTEPKDCRFEKPLSACPSDMFTKAGSCRF